MEKLNALEGDDKWGLMLWMINTLGAINEFCQIHTHYPEGTEDVPCDTEKLTEEKLAEIDEETIQNMDEIYCHMNKYYC